MQNNFLTINFSVTIQLCLSVKKCKIISSKSTEKHFFNKLLCCILHCILYCVLCCVLYCVFCCVLYCVLYCLLTVFHVLGKLNRVDDGGQQQSNHWTITVELEPLNNNSRIGIEPWNNNRNSGIKLLESLNSNCCIWNRTLQSFKYQMFWNKILESLNSNSGIGIKP